MLSEASVSHSVNRRGSLVPGGSLVPREGVSAHRGEGVGSPLCY